MALAQADRGSDAVTYAGVQGYVGNHQNTVDYDRRKPMSRELLAPLVLLVERLHREDLAPAVVSGAGTGTHDFDYELGVLTEVQGGTYALMDVNYRDAVLRRDDPHPFGPRCPFAATVISTAQPGFVVADAGIKELDCIFGIEHPGILRGAPAGAVYSLVGDDMGRIDLADGRRAGRRRRGRAAAAALLPDARHVPPDPLRARRRPGRHLDGRRARPVVSSRF